jgi:hypothetical protein
MPDGKLDIPGFLLVGKDADILPVHLTRARLSQGGGIFLFWRAIMML